MKLLVSITTYPRDGKSTYKILERTVNSLFQEINKKVSFSLEKYCFFKFSISS